MIHRRDNSNNKSISGKNITLAVLVAVSFFILLYAPLRNTITQTVYVIAPTVWGFGDRVTDARDSFFANFRNRDFLVKENEMLLIEVDRMEAQVLDRNLLAEKVTKLEEALGRVRSDNRVVADVVAGPGRSPYDTLVIDAGAEEGINIGDVVVYSGSSIIGEIVETAPASSKVKLYSSPGEEQFVIVGQRNLPVVALGRGMGNFEAKVPQDSVVAVGDSIVSVKGDLIFGTVSSIEEKPAEPFKRLFFRAPFNITEIRSVEVIADKHF
ncbi:MAG: hypothetical protein A2747_03695 [Candidatus Yonathbacteria bacterium RIFCSPHIGHO2_01_FULL_44_41]|uniref:Cell shape-determining protein MreC n=1 Tax=Candidatus Yonathbacteria bacterium RIFCSPHIGHO2_02_FULL_44_14 TaxID=1802724 RepID=A0A1G2S7R2_9BACT|nr:MAG: hypothetical protein A2747_03695 [Candidatus Yonathbacteria bacterium RIFCSPHIGHO2_01_FULL_44_41]OHA81027.1 MAG: hypothetical protein A3D51_01585 [Candidatus Yonathbacteria bacterium RIFCSPHIGHO2_02_FULL_44_14]OHA81250.1 MAG: hypothetical protein A3B06_03295 [Candidatus Yonathbacteria bacterium RIFCSPLOWO2_01_FULL_43_20]